MIVSAPNTFIENAEIMPKGQVTLPQNVRNVLGIDNGSKVTFIVENNSVRIVNSAVYAMQKLREEMKDEASESGLNSEEKIIDIIKDMRQRGE